MAYSIYQMTGALRVDKVTPVIKALFSEFNLDANDPGDGQVSFSNLDGGSIPWEIVLDNLIEVLNELPAKGLHTDENEEEDEEADSGEAVAREIRERLDLPHSADFEAFIDATDFEGSAALEDLVTLADYLNDGHNLSEVLYSGSWHSSKPLFLEFGGNGFYSNKHFTMASSSATAFGVGLDVGNALAAGDIEKAADALARTIEEWLSGVTDPDAASQLRDSLSNKIRGY
jgi:hypothetical protein